MINNFSFAQINFVNQADTIGVNHSYGFGYAGGGVSVVDINNDGWDDLTLATQEGDNLQIYLNDNGNLILQPDLIDNTTQSKQILWVDFDNDGDKDLFVACFDGVNRLYENDGDLNFTDITLSSGLPFITTPTYGASFGDYNRDGYLDLYFTYKTNNFSTNRNFLYKNNGDGTFLDVTFSSLSADLGKSPFCSSFLDFNNDNWPDIYTAQDKTTTNTLLRNNGDGTFTDESENSNSDLVMNAMCVAVGDYDNNGYSDIYVSNTPDGNALLQNNGDDTFEEVATATGTLFEGTGWGSNFFDADNDGDLDLYVSAMIIGATSQISVFYQNEGNGIFSQPNAGFIGDTVTVFSNAIGDFNNDGYPDIMTNTFQNPSAVWENQGGNNNWIKVKLEGVVSNRDGIGSRIEIYNNGQKQIRYTHCGIGYLGQNSETEIIGIGNENNVDSIKVLWSSGHTDILYDQPAGDKLYIIEGSTTNDEIYIDTTANFEIIDVGINSLSNTKDHGIIISPNPVNEFLNITSTKNEQIQSLTIHNTMGKVLQTFDLKNQIDISFLHQGYYFIKVKTKENEIIIPFIKINY